MAKDSTTRRAARERALRILYTLDVSQQPLQEVLDDSLQSAEFDPSSAAFVERLVIGTHDHQSAVDAVVNRLATGFPIDRQTVVDRNILRLAAADILYHLSDASPGGIVNEAVELAKKYSTGESGKFVNGVLGALVRETEATQQASVAVGEPAHE